MGNHAVCPRIEAGLARCVANCAKVTLPGGAEVFPEDTDPCDPVGAIFEETLEHLSELDRQLLLFSSGSNLAALRWLFLLGANKDASDLNGTTALHAACRTGTLSAVRELLARGVPVDSVDRFGWTPLHIAVTMGRRGVALCLLTAGASLSTKNIREMTPMEMCSDPVLREAIQAYMLREAEAGNSHELSASMDIYARDIREDGLSLYSLQYEPFFVPREPVISETRHQQELLSVGKQIFSRRAGQGLAFLVAAGCVRDYPVDLSLFLRRGKLDLSQIGNFLGESFSLSQTLRLEFINSVKFRGTSVVTGLSKVFKLLRIPPDLQKIDRLVHGVATIWWRQHDKLSREQDELGSNFNLEVGVDDSEFTKGGNGELSSFSLKQYLGGPDTLYQLMFSAIMLHWNLYAPAPSAQDGSRPVQSAQVPERINMEEWLHLNKGLEADGGDVPTTVLQRTFDAIRKSFVPQLAIRTQNSRPKPPRTAGAPLGSSTADSDAVPGERASLNQGGLLSNLCIVEGWALSLGQSLSKSPVAGATTRSAFVQNIFSEATTSANLPPDLSPRTQTCGGFGKPEGVPWGPSSPWHGDPDTTQSGLFGMSSQDDVWLSVCGTVLLLSVSPDEAPYAFVDMRKAYAFRSGEGANAAVGSSNSSLVITLTGCNHVEAELFGTASRTTNGKSEKPVSARTGGLLGASALKPLAVVFLLPDGRWQECPTTQLDFQLVAPVDRLSVWLDALQRASRGEVSPPADPEAGAGPAPGSSLKEQVQIPPSPLREPPAMGDHMDQAL